MTERNYGVILTDIGRAALANAHLSGTSLKLKKFSIGEGTGPGYNPSVDEMRKFTAIPGEWDKRNLSSITKGKDAGKWVAEGNVPADVGGKFVRIVGYWLESGDLYAVGLYPEFPKPAPSSPLAVDLPIRAYMATAGDANITFEIDPSITMASQQYVNDSLKTSPIYDPKKLERSGIRTLVIVTKDDANAAFNLDAMLTGDQLTIVKVSTKSKVSVIHSTGKLYRLSGKQANLNTVEWGQPRRVTFVKVGNDVKIIEE